MLIQQWRKEEIWKDWEVFRIFNTNGHAYIFFIPIDLYRPSIRICVCVCVCVCTYVHMRKREAAHEKALYYSPPVRLSFSIFRSFVREFFVSVHLLSTHTVLHKLNGSDRHAMSVVVIVCLWKKDFFSYIFCEHLKKLDKDIFHSLFPPFRLSLSTSSYQQHPPWVISMDITIKNWSAHLPPTLGILICVCVCDL